MLDWKGKTWLKTVSVTLIIAFIAYDLAWATDFSPISRKECAPNPGSKSLFKNKKINYDAMKARNEYNLNTIKDMKNSANLKDTSNYLKISYIKDIADIYINDTVGKVIDSYSSPDSKGTIIYIQDLHANPEAGINLSKILENLIKDYNLDLICSEGASGVVDTSSVSNFPDKELKEKVAKAFIDSGELTGEEYLSITKYPNFPIWGIEDEEAYFQHIIEFHKIMKFNPDALIFINQVKVALNKLKLEIYSKALLDIDCKEMEYEGSKIDAIKYLDYLLSIAKDINLANYKNISIFKEALEAEKTIDQSKIIKESQDILSNLRTILKEKDNKYELNTLLVKASLFKDKKISPFLFYSYLDELSRRQIKNNLDNYADMFNYATYLKQINSIDSAKLFNEIEELSYDIKNLISDTDNQKLLTKSIRSIRFLEKFFNLKISNEELDSYLKDKKFFKVSFFKDFLQANLEKYDINSFVDYNYDLINKNLIELESFYDIAHKRDLAMFNNTIAEIEKRKSKTIAMIAGGFHTNGITKLLKDNGYSYVVIFPYSRIETDERNYKDLLSGKSKSLSELFIGFNNKLRPLMGFVNQGFRRRFNNTVLPALNGALSADEVNLEHRFITALDILSREKSGKFASNEVSVSPAVSNTVSQTGISSNLEIAAGATHGISNDIQASDVDATQKEFTVALESASTVDEVNAAIDVLVRERAYTPELLAQAATKRTEINALVAKTRAQAAFTALLGTAATIDAVEAAVTALKAANADTPELLAIAEVTKAEFTDIDIAIEILQAEGARLTIEEVARLALKTPLRHLSPVQNTRIAGIIAKAETASKDKVNKAMSTADLSKQYKNTVGIFLVRLTILIAGFIALSTKTASASLNTQYGNQEFELPVWLVGGGILFLIIVAIWLYSKLSAAVQHTETMIETAWSSFTTKLTGCLVSLAITIAGLVAAGTVIIAGFTMLIDTVKQKFSSASSFGDGLLIIVAIIAGSGLLLYVIKVLTAHEQEISQDKIAREIEDKTKAFRHNTADYNYQQKGINKSAIIALVLIALLVIAALLFIPSLSSEQVSVPLPQPNSSYSLLSGLEPLLIIFGVVAVVLLIAWGLYRILNKGITAGAKRLNEIEQSSVKTYSSATYSIEQRRGTWATVGIIFGSLLLTTLVFGLTFVGTIDPDNINIESVSMPFITGGITLILSCLIGGFALFSRTREQNAKSQELGYDIKDIQRKHSFTDLGIAVATIALVGLGIIAPWVTWVVMAGDVLGATIPAVLTLGSLAIISSIFIRDRENTQKDYKAIRSRSEGLYREMEEVNSFNESAKPIWNIFTRIVQWAGIPIVLFGIFLFSNAAWTLILPIVYIAASGGIVMLSRSLNFHAAQVESSAESSWSKVSSPAGKIRDQGRRLRAEEKGVNSFAIIGSIVIAVGLGAMGLILHEPLVLFSAVSGVIIFNIALSITVGIEAGNYTFGKETKERVKRIGDIAKQQRRLSRRELFIGIAVVAAVVVSIIGILLIDSTNVVRNVSWIFNSGSSFENILESELFFGYTAAIASIIVGYFACRLVIAAIKKQDLSKIVDKVQKVVEDFYDFLIFSVTLVAAELAKVGWPKETIYESIPRSVMLKVNKHKDSLLSQDSSMFKRQMAADSLGNMGLGIPEVIDALSWALLYDEAIPVRITASIALAKTGSSKALHPLYKRLVLVHMKYLFNYILGKNVDLEQKESIAIRNAISNIKHKQALRVALEIDKTVLPASIKALRQSI